MSASWSKPCCQWLERLLEEWQVKFFFPTSQLRSSLLLPNRLRHVAEFARYMDILDFPLLLLPKLSIRCTSRCELLWINAAMITQAWHFNRSCQVQRSELHMTWRRTSCEVATNFVQNFPAYIADFVASGLHIQQCILILFLYNVHYLCTCAGVPAAQSSRWAAHIKQVPFTMHYMLFIYHSLYVPRPSPCSCIAYSGTACSSVFSAANITNIASMDSVIELTKARLPPLSHGIL